MSYKTEDIDLLLSQLSIEEVVGEFITLKKTGANSKGLCPFHADNSPSFMVNSQKNICKCFVCGEGGNPITFYSKYKKISFNEAVSELAKKYQVNIKEIAPTGAKSHQNKYYEIMDEAHNFYKKNIFSEHSHRAMEYLSKRDMTPKIITENGIGFAAGKGQELTEYLLQKGYSIDDLIKLGLSRQNERGNYDFFRERIIFPIFSSFNKVIAFGGRTIENGDGIPKYINSQDTPVFHKGSNLYGIERGQSIKKRTYAILMEGYMDVLSAYVYGFDTAVAPLGTALTEEQGVLLKKYTSNVLICFDSDNAGQMATEKAIMILTKLEFKVRVIKLNGAKDPDEYLKAYGKEAFLERIKNSLTAFDFLYEYYAKDFNLTDMFARLNFIKKFKDFFQVVSTKFEQDMYLGELSANLDIDKDSLSDELIMNNQKKTVQASRFVNLRNRSEFNKEKLINQLEKETISYILTNANDFRFFNFFSVENKLTKKVFNFIEERFRNKDVDLIKELKELNDIDEDERAVIEEIVCNSVAGFTDEKEKKIKKTEIYKGWFRKELMPYKNMRENFNLTLNVVKIENKLKNSDDFIEVLNIYKEFEKIVVFQDI
ncbi:DNA primase [Fusobacterium sp. PH5-44]|uniref:DNA primase n=1 Tax=unclassified Fusobacterium TaxID=2648384 RepID=UPI003D1DDCCE